MGSRVLVLHPGAHVGAGMDAGIASIVKGLNEVLTDDTDCFVALETMAGKGSEIGRNFEELARIYDGVAKKDRLRVCFDTCHTHDSGYDIIHDFDGVMTEFDRILGKDQIAVFHINDSKNPCGAGKDRHENLGQGHIRFDALKQIVHHPDFEEVPKILETPWIPIDGDKKNTRAPYKAVSYTHLDVYKRQHSIFICSFISCTLSFHLFFNIGISLHPFSFLANPDVYKRQILYLSMSTINFLCIKPSQLDFAYAPSRCVACAT